MIGTVRPTAEFIMQNSVAISGTGCWEWLASKNNWGYGRLGPMYSPRAAHKASYEAFLGYIPKTLCVLHKCDNLGCVNPEHLRLGTVADNNADNRQKGRHVALRGESNPLAKLNDALVQGIRLAYAGRSSVSKLATQYGVSRRSIRFVVDRKTWRHVP